MKRLLPVILGFTLFTVAFTYPATLHLSDKVIGDGGDSLQFLSFQHLARQQFENGQFPFGWTNYWRYPAGFDLSISYDSTILLLTGIFFYQFTGDPVLVYNLSLLIILVINCFLSFFLFREVTKNEIYGFLGGLIYGFSFYVIARLGGHPNLLLTGVFPFFTYALILLWQNQADGRSLTVTAIAVSLIFLSSLQYLLISLSSLIIVIPLFFIFYKNGFLSFFKLIRKRIRGILTASLITLSVFLLFHFKRISAMFTGSLIMPTNEFVSVPWINFFIPNIYLSTFSSMVVNETKKWIEYAVFFGYLEIIIFISGLLFFIFGKNVDGFYRKLVLFLLTIFIIFFIISLGYGYQYLFPFLPFRGVIEPDRFSIIAYLCLTLVIVLFLHKIYRELIGLGLIAVLLIVSIERMPVNFYLSETHKDERFIDAVKNADSKAVLDLPVFLEWWHGNEYDLYSLYYQKPIVNGYIHWSGNTKDSQYFTDGLKRFTCSMDPEFTPQTLKEEDLIKAQAENNKLFPLLKAYGISTIVIHRNLSYDSNQCGEVKQYIDILVNTAGERVNKLFENRDKVVYQLN